MSKKYRKVDNTQQKKKKEKKYGDFDKPIESLMRLVPQLEKCVFDDEK